MLKQLAFLSILTASVSINSMHLPKSSVRITSRVGKVKLVRNEKNRFIITQNKKKTKVKNYDVDPLLRKMSSEQLKIYLMKNSIAVNKLSNGDFTLKAKTRGVGGGPWTAYTVYCATKASLIGALVAGTAAAVCATGGAAAGAASAIAAGTATAGGTAVGVVSAAGGSMLASATVGSGAGAVIAGVAVVGGTDAAIAGTALVAGATMASAATTGTAVGVGAAAGASAAVIAAIEAASMAAAAPFLSCPWCP